MCLFEGLSLLGFVYFCVISNGFSLKFAHFRFGMYESRLLSRNTRVPMFEIGFAAKFDFEVALHISLVIFRAYLQ